MAFPTDLEIARKARLEPLEEIAASLGIGGHLLEPYGESVAKIKLEAVEELAERPKAKYVLVSAITPTPLGEGKSTMTVGLGQAFKHIGKTATVAIRQPSMGPTFGIKGGAAGGGYSQVVPMETFNLHLTGDNHAVTAAHNMLAAMIDNHIHHNDDFFHVDRHSVGFRRVLDINDRALRNVITGLGERVDGVVRETGFDITPASEVMAILALSVSLKDLRERLGRIVVGNDTAGNPITSEDLKAAGVMAVIMKEAIKPNLMQTLENTPALVHAGPFGNIAHGCNSVVATKSALALADIVVTEAGFGSDLGAEKFFDIKCRSAGLNPEAAVLVATIRALKMNGGAAKAKLGTEDLAALERGLPNLEHHIMNVKQFGLPVVVAVNRFTSDTDAELKMVIDAARRAGVRVAMNEVWARGGAGGEELAHEVLGLLNEGAARFAPLYDVNLGIREKIAIVASKVYGASGVDYSPKAERSIEYLQSIGLGTTPICMAKTQYSLSDDATKLGRPTGFRITVNEVYPAAGAGFVVAQCGDIMTMPGLPKEPAAERMAVRPDGSIVGLF